MRIIEKPHFLSIESPEGGKLTAIKTNRGEPYREVIELDLYMGNEWDGRIAGVTLGGHEAIKLRDFLNRVYPLPEANHAQ